MKTLTIALFALLAVSVCAETKTTHKPSISDPNVTFMNHFYTQVDVTNRALEKVINLPCQVDKQVLQVNLDELLEEVSKTATLTNNIPKTQDPITQMQEIETFYGMADVVKMFMNARIDFCRPKQDKTPSNSSE